VDFARLHVLQQAGAFFVTRAKPNVDTHRVYSAPADRSAGVICDQTIAMDGYLTPRNYPTHLRRIRFKDPETGKTLAFLTNQTTLPALTICALYKSRWEVELFFKWIKQHLRIKQFYGISENAVKTQIWIAVSVYVLIAIVRKRLRLEVSLYTLIQVFSVTIFEKMPIQAIILATPDRFDDAEDSNQLELFTFLLDSSNDGKEIKTIKGNSITHTTYILPAVSIKYPITLYFVFSHGVSKYYSNGKKYFVPSCFYVVHINAHSGIVAMRACFTDS